MADRKLKAQMAEVKRKLFDAAPEVVPGMLKALDAHTESWPPEAKRAVWDATKVYRYYLSQIEKYLALLEEVFPDEAASNDVAARFATVIEGWRKTWQEYANTCYTQHIEHLDRLHTARLNRSDVARKRHMQNVWRAVEAMQEGRTAL